MSLKANDKNGLLTYIEHAVPGEYYYCQTCGQPMIQRRGIERIHHFAHVSPHGHLGIVPCSDHWNYDKTEWHIEWQKRFPVECMERVLESSGKKHIADILVGNYVVEFQHSPISSEDFNERNAFYTNLGYKVIWVFDVIEDYDCGRLCDSRYSGIYKWAYPKRLFKEMNFEEVKAAIYFQFTNDEKEGVCGLEMLKDVNCEANTIKTDIRNALSINEFVEMIKNNDSSIFEKESIPVAPNVLPNCSTIQELWHESFSKMLVKNTFNSKVIFVFGKNGELVRDFQTGKIRCCYTYLNKYTGLYEPQKQFYNAFDSDKKIWILVHGFKDPKYEKRKTDIQNIHNLNKDGCRSLDDIVMYNKSKYLIVKNIYTEKYYYLSFIDDKELYMRRFDIYEYDPETGAIMSEHAINGVMYTFYKYNIWKI